MEMSIVPIRQNDRNSCPVLVAPNCQLSTHGFDPFPNPYQAKSIMFARRVEPTSIIAQNETNVVRLEGQARVEFSGGSMAQGVCQDLLSNTQ